MNLPDPVALAIPGFIVLMIAELALGYFRLRAVRYELKDTAASLIMGVGNLATGIPFLLLIYGFILALYEIRLFDIGFQWWAFVAIFFAQDFCYYWFHRLSHEHRFWWAAHINHHSSQHYNLSTALRQTWTGNVAGTFIVYAPLPLLGFPPAMIAFSMGISLVYQFWIHTEAIGRLPAPIEWVFTQPGAAATMRSSSSKTTMGRGVQPVSGTAQPRDSSPWSKVCSRNGDPSPSTASHSSASTSP